jgi:PAS domain S-box-containing protein
MPMTTPLTEKGPDAASRSDDLDVRAVLRAVIDICDDAIFTTDASGNITSWSGTSERLFGLPEVLVIQRAMDLLFPDHVRVEVRGVSGRALTGEHVRHFETEVLRPEGMPVPISISMSPVSDGGDRVVGLVVVARDVTEQHLAQATLAEVERRLEDGEALAHVGSWLWDVRTGAVQWSTELHRIHGIEPVQFDGTFESHLAVIHPDDRDRIRTVMVQSVASRRPLHDEYRIVRPDGAVRVVRVRAQPAMGSGRTAVGLRGTGQDVTDVTPPADQTQLIRPS